MDFKYFEERGQFKCNASLSIPKEDIKPLFAQGTGANKKESKKSALE